MATNLRSITSNPDTASADMTFAVVLVVLFVGAFVLGWMVHKWTEEDDKEE